jgi:ESS family glutamate:Na+ symporter
MNFWDSSLWDGFAQFGFLCILFLVSNIIRRKVPLFRKSLLPTAVIGGILGLIIKELGWMSFVSDNFLNVITYHFMAIGFIALSMKTQYGQGDNKNDYSKDAFNSGLLIVSTYLVQAVIGFGITYLMAVTVMPDLFPAAGLLLPLGFGQGPGQANNWGITYETMGFVGGQSFGLTVASLGFLWACIPGVIYINYLNRKGKFNLAKGYKNASVDDEFIGGENEIPLGESIDKFTIQICFVMLVFMITYGFMFGVDEYLIKTNFLGNFGFNTLRPLLWGFNFIFGTLFAILVKVVLKKFKRYKLMRRTYLNNFMLNRIAGVAFDFMIICSIILIDINVLSDLWIPLILVTTIGGFVTLYYLIYASSRIYKSYPIEGFLAMYGMLTGTASTGVAILREADPNFDTPASQNLVSGSVVAIVFGFPMLLLLGTAPYYPLLTFILLVLFLIVINILLFREQIFKSKKIRRT